MIYSALRAAALGFSILVPFFVWWLIFSVIFSLLLSFALEDPELCAEVGMCLSLWIVIHFGHLLSPAL